MLPMPRLSLLNKELFQVQTHEERAQMTLPAILLALTQDNVVSFDALQSHQE